MRRSSGRSPNEERAGVDARFPTRVAEDLRIEADAEMGRQYRDQLPGHLLLPQADRSPGKTWDDVPQEIKDTFDKLGIPEAERKFLSGVKAQFESEVVYGSLKEDLATKGVIFTDTDTAVREHSELLREYFGTVIPPHDNKFAALNSAVWSGGSFIYVRPA
jgi:Fe-S cluster assembly scaffold protein SufB